MKSISKFIAEKYLIDTDINVETDVIDALTNLLIETILKNQKLTKNNFEKHKHDAYVLSNIPKDGKLADDFYARRDELINLDKNTTISSYSYINSKLVEILFKNKKGITNSVFVKVYLVNTKRTYDGWKEGEIICIEISKEIKDKLFQKYNII